MMCPKLLLAAALVVAVAMVVVGTAEAQTGKEESRVAAKLAEAALGDHVGKKVLKKLVQPAADRIFRRSLQQRDRYISYQALRANSIPCGKQGNSYYDCSYRMKSNPYSRGCTEATRCFRYTH